MPIQFVELPEVEPRPRRQAERMERQRAYLETEIDNALSARAPQEKAWGEAMRQYKAIPDKEMSFEPVKMRNIEVPIGAWAVEQAYAQHDLLAVNTNPPVTVQSGPSGRWVDHARAVQEFVNWVGRNELRAADVSRTVFLDNCQKGTGIYYVPWEVQIKRTVGTKIIWDGPVGRRIRPEDFLVPEGHWLGLEPPHGPPWCAVRFFLNEGQMRAKGRYEDWDIDGASPTINREAAAQLQAGSEQDSLYEVWQCWVNSHVWYDDDDAPADMLITFDATSKQILDIRWSPYDCRPFEVMRYQRQTDTFWGMGIMEMLAPIQAEASDFHQDRSRNRKVVNQRAYVAQDGSIVGEQEIGAGTVLLTRAPGAIQPLQHIPVFGNEMAEEQMLFAMAQQRTGISDSPGPEAGQRTPATTESIKSNQRNSRAAPAVNDMAQAFAGMHIQALRRYHEKLRLEIARAENAAMLGRERTAMPVSEHILSVMGPQKGQLVLEALSDPNFSRELSIETTATSGTLNREAERQHFLQAIPVLLQGSEKKIQGISLMEQTTNPVLREAIRQGIIALTELEKRYLGTLDIRDSDAIVFDIRTQTGAGAGSEAALAGALAQPPDAVPPGLVDLAAQQQASQPAQGGLGLG